MRAALAALAALVAVLQGCGEPPKGSPGQESLIDCAHEAPRLCGMAGKVEYLPGNLKILCGGTQDAGEHHKKGGMLFSFCKENCQSAEATSTVHTMTICVAETLVKTEVVQWGHYKKGAASVPSPVCEQVLKRVCMPGAAPEYEPLCKDEQRSQLVQYCEATCTLHAGLADCLNAELTQRLVALKQSGGPAPAAATGAGQLKFLQTVEACVLSEAFGTPFDKIPRHSNDILQAAQPHSGHAAGTLEGALEQLQANVGLSGDTEPFKRDAAQEQAQLAQDRANAAHDEAMNHFAMGDVQSYGLMPRAPAGAVTGEIVADVHYPSGVTTPSIELKKQLQAKPATHDSVLELGESRDSVAPAYGVGRAEAVYHGASTASAPQRASWVVGPHGAKHGTLAPDDDDE